MVHYTLDYIKRIIKEKPRRDRDGRFEGIPERNLGREALKHFQENPSKYGDKERRILTLYFRQEAKYFFGEAQIHYYKAEKMLTNMKISTPEADSKVSLAGRCAGRAIQNIEALLLVEQYGDVTEELKYLQEARKIARDMAVRIEFPTTEFTDDYLSIMREFNSAIKEEKYRKAKDILTQDVPDFFEYMTSRIPQRIERTLSYLAHKFGGRYPQRKDGKNTRDDVRRKGGLE